MQEKVRPLRRRRRRTTLVYPLRLAIVVIAGMAGAWTMFQVLLKIIHPYKLGYEESKKVAALRVKLDKQDAANTTLRKQVAYLESEEGAECAARRQGYHRPGETVYLLDKDAIAAAESAATERERTGQNR
jgi:cell division protein FtsB